MPPSDDATINNDVPDHPSQPNTADPAEEHVEIHYAAVRWSRPDNVQADPDGEEPYGHINPDAFVVPP